MRIILTACAAITVAACGGGNDTRWKPPVTTVQAPVPPGPQGVWDCDGKMMAVTDGSWAGRPASVSRERDGTWSVRGSQDRAIITSVGERRMRWHDPATGRVANCVR